MAHFYIYLFHVAVGTSFNCEYNESVQKNNWVDNLNRLTEWEVSSLQFQLLDHRLTTKAKQEVVCRQRRHCIASCI